MFSLQRTHIDRKQIREEVGKSGGAYHLLCAKKLHII